ncbi:MAG: autotransporter domain-containing protein [Parvibaculum sp.]|nr:autotransporter domain-containing protein [Parvibaculum sp.]
MKSPFTTARLSLRIRLLSSTALAVVGAVWMASAGPAQAAPGGSCVTTTPGGVTTITCDGFTDDQVYAGDDHTVVTLNADAVVSYEDDPAIVLNNSDSSLTMNADSTAYTYGSRYAVVSDGDRNTITLNDGAAIENTNTLYGDYNYAAVGLFTETGSDLTLNGGSRIAMNGGTDNSHYDNFSFRGVYAQGQNIDITLNGASTITVYGIGTEGENKYAGVVFLDSSTTASTRSSIVLNGASTVNVIGSYASDGNDLIGIIAAGQGYSSYTPTVVLNGASSVNVEGHLGTSNNKYIGIEAIGRDAGVTLNGGSSVNVTGDGGGANNKYLGLVAIDYSESDGFSQVTLNGGSSVNITSGAGSTDATMAGILSKGYTEGKSVALNGGSSVVLTSYGDSSVILGIENVGLGVVTELNGASSIQINALGEGGGNKYIGVLNFELSESAAGAGRITLNGGSSVTLQGDASTNTKYVGILSFGIYPPGKYTSDVTLSDSNVSIYGGAGSGNKYVGVAVLGNGATVALNGASRIFIDAYDGDDGFALGVVGYGIGNSVVLNGTSGINIYAARSDAAAGISLYGPGSTVTLNGASHVTLDLYGGDSGVGIVGRGGGTKVTLSGESTVRTRGWYFNALYGIDLRDGDNFVTLNGDSSISATGSYVDAVEGIHLNGDRNTVVLNGNSTVYAGGNDSVGYAAGILSRGDYASITMNGASRVAAGGFGVEDAKGIRINGYGSSVTLNDDASIGVVAYGSGNRLGGIVLNDNSHMSATLNDNSYIETLGVAGIYVRDTSESTVTLNGNSYIESIGDVGIHLHDVTDMTIEVGAGSFVRGTRAIQLRGDSNDIIVAGTLYATNNNAITLNGFNNTITLNSGVVEGEIRGAGNGTDELVLQGAGALGYRVRDIGALDVSASGIWNLLDTGTFEVATINSGKLAVNGTLNADSITVRDGGTLGGSGVVNGEVTVEAGGIIAPGNSPGTLNIVGNTTLNSGSIFEVEIEGLLADLLNVDGDVTIAPGAILTPHFLGGVDGFVGDVLTVTGGHTVTGAFLIGSGGAADYTDPTKVSLTAVSSSSMNGGLSAGASTGFTFLDTVLGQAEKGIGRSHNLWASALWHQSDRTADGNSRGFSQKGSGGAFGGNVMESGSMTLGLAGGYIDNDAVTAGGGTTTKIKGYHLAAYTSYGMGATTLTGAVTAAYQDQDISRNVLSGGAIVGANSTPEAWVVGAGFGIGHAIALEKGFTLTPKASFGWQHMTRESLTETGGGLGGMSVGEITTDTMRGQAGAELSLMVRDPNAMWSVRPSIRAGVAQEWRAGDDNARGTFTSTGAAFTATLDTRDQTYLAVGAGVDITLGGSITGFLTYDGGFGGDAEKSGGVRLGARFEW